MIQSPQLKENLNNLSGEKTKPPAPEIPRFPLDAPSKKIVVEAELIHNDLNASMFTWNRHGGELTGLTHTDFLNLDGLEPSHVEIVEGKDEEDVEFPAYSVISSLILCATIWGVVIWLLNISCFWWGKISTLYTSESSARAWTNQHFYQFFEDVVHSRKGREKWLEIELRQKYLSR